MRSENKLHQTADRIISLAQTNVPLTDPNKVWICTVSGRRAIAADLDRCMQVSFQASRQQKEVAMTPYMKNALYHFGDLKGEERLMVDSPVTKAEEYIQRAAKRELMKQFGTERTEYDRKLQPTDIRHYAVDCWRNFKTGISMRDIQPGQEHQREEGFTTFRTPFDDADAIASVLKHDSEIQIALNNVINSMPHNIKLSSEFVDWAGPFGNKHTQVSWPFAYRDDVVVSAVNDPMHQLNQYYGETYGKMCIDIAKHTPVPDTLHWCVSTGYGRNQRGKGRPLVAMARVPAVVYNRMTRPETEMCKTSCSFFLGYNDRSTLKNGMIRQAEVVVNNGWCMENFDYHAFDQSIAPYWLALAGAVWYELAADNASKEVVLYRSAYPISGYLIDGLAHGDKRIAPIYGRMLSGFIETNKTENVINCVASSAAMLKQDATWLDKIVRRSPYPRIYMGDDCLITYDPKSFDHDDYVKDIANFGFEVHPDKGEFGAFFLQNRLMCDDGYIMAYPWTRVLRSVFFKETSRGLGPCGWTLATWSQLANIAEYKPGLAFVRDMVMQFDEQKLMLNTPIAKIIAGVQQEDEAALSENKRARTTYEIINDGDPGKHQVSDSDSKFLTELQRLIREA